MKKLLSLLLVMCMLMSMAACVGKEPIASEPTEPTASEPTEPSATEPTATEPSVNNAEIIIQAEKPSDKTVDMQSRTDVNGNPFDHSKRVLAADGLEYLVRSESVIVFSAFDRYTYTFEAEAGTYTLSVVASCDRSSPIRYSLNGASDKVTNFISNDYQGYSKVELDTVELKDGLNTITFTIIENKNHNMWTDYYVLTPASNGNQNGDGSWDDIIDAAMKQEQITAQQQNAVWKELYVAPGGSDSNAGTKSAPFATIAGANAAIKNLRSQMKGDIIVNVASGYYQISEPIVISSDGAGANGYRVIYRGDNSDMPVISGGVQVSGWTKVDSKVWSAPVNVEDARTFYVNDNLTVRARSKYLYTATENYKASGSGNTSDGMSLANLNFPQNLTNTSEIELVFDREWRHHRCLVSDILYTSDKVTLVMQQPMWQAIVTKQTTKTDPGVNKAFYIENAKELLDEPGEFYFDKTEKRIYYYPFENEDMSTAKCYVGNSEGLLKIKGTGVNSLVDGLTFENISFKYGAWNELSDTGLITNQADNITTSATAVGDKLVPGQISVEYANNITFRNCRFACLGSTALTMSNAVSNSLIEGNVFTDISGIGISIGHFNHLDTMPSGMARCVNIDVLNNVIRRIGAELRSSPAIMMYYVNTVRVMHNDIADIPYSGIDLGWGWGRVVNGCANNIIAYNKIADAVNPTHDGAHIYILGPIKGTYINNNWCINSNDMRGGLYPDEGAAYLNIFQNVIQEVDNWLFARPNVNLMKINVFNNYTDTAKMTQDTHNVVVENTTVVTNGKWPAEAVAIMNEAGVQAQYKNLLTGVEKPEWRKNMVKDIPDSAFVPSVNAWIQAEDFDEGGQGVGYYKHKLGQFTDDNWKHPRPEAIDVWIAPFSTEEDNWAIGETVAGEWLAYTIYAGETKSYELQIRYSNGFPTSSPDSKVSVYMDGKKIIDSVVLERGKNWNDYIIKTVGNVTISAGVHTFKVEFVSNGFSFDAWRLKGGEEITNGNDPSFDEGIYMK